MIITAFKITMTYNQARLDENGHYYIYDWEAETIDIMSYLMSGYVIGSSWWTY